MDRQRALETAAQLCATAELMIRAANHPTSGGVIEDELLRRLAADLQRQADIMRCEVALDDS